MPGLTIGDLLPNLEVETTQGKMKLFDYVNDSFTIIFSHPGQILIHLLLFLLFISYCYINLFNFYHCFSLKHCINNLVLDHVVGNFTPVCTTELGAMAQYADKFSQRGVKLLGLSCDDLQSHEQWTKDIEAFNVVFSLYPSIKLSNMAT